MLSQFSRENKPDGPGQQVVAALLAEITADIAQRQVAYPPDDQSGAWLPSPRLMVIQRETEQARRRRLMRTIALLLRGGAV
jgi:hypothetical protein